MDLSTASERLFDSLDLWKSNKKPWKLVDKTVIQALSQPFGQHSAIHMLQEIQNRYHPINPHIADLLNGSSFLERLRDIWNIQKHIITSQDTIMDMFSSKNDSNDLRLLDSFNCDLCYEFINGQELTRGYIFACFTSPNAKMGETPLQIFSLPRMTLFKLSIINERWFRVYWESFQNMSLPPIEPIDVERICRFVDVELADQLYLKSFDLSRFFHGQWFGWTGVIARGDPEAMLNWLLKHGSLPPSGFLVEATNRLCITTVRWTLENIRVDLKTWKDAASLTCFLMNEKAVPILEVILQNRHKEMPKNSEVTGQFSQDLLNDIVEIACGRVLNHDSRWSVTQPMIEGITTGKILALGNEAFDVSDLIVQTKAANLHQVTIMLESFITDMQEI